MKFRKVFPQRAFLPVIHVESESQALRNARTAREGGADGIFLINHGVPYHQLLEAYRACRAEHPTWWIGLNALDLPSDQAFARAPVGADGIWTDAAGADDRTHAAKWLLRRHGWKGLHFGGVAFKGQPDLGDLASEARAAIFRMDVLTTSGPATGQAAPPEKLRALRAAAGGTPIAVASGVTPENVGDSLPYVDAFLVATGISLSHTELDPARVRRLADRIRAS